jgi:hypothetical protein
MTMRCRNGEPHTHETTAEARACWKPAAVTTAPTPRDCRPATEGMYVKEGVIYKVVTKVYGDRPGFLYTQQLTDEGFRKVRGVLRTLTQADRMTMEAAKAYGDLYHRCVRCQAVLELQESIDRGMGEVCAGKI